MRVSLLSYFFTKRLTYLTLTFINLSLANAQINLPTFSDTGTASTQGSVNDCPYFINSQRFADAALTLTINSPCRQQELVTINYQDYRYTLTLNENGIASTPIFLTHPNAQATLQFVQSPPVDIRLITKRLPTLDRVLLAWYGKTQLDLHTLPFGAALNGSTDIWRQTHCTTNSHPDTSHSFYCLRSTGDNPLNLQVYTRQRNSDDKRRGIVDFRVDFFTRGSQAAHPYCGSHSQGSQAFTTQRISKGRAGRLKQHRILPVACGTQLNEQSRYARGFIRHLNIR